MVPGLRKSEKSTSKIHVPGYGSHLGGFGIRHLSSEVRNQVRHLFARNAYLFLYFISIFLFILFFYVGVSVFVPAGIVPGPAQHSCPICPPGDDLLYRDIALKYFKNVLECYELHILEKPVGLPDANGVYSQESAENLEFNLKRKKEIERFTKLRDSWQLQRDQSIVLDEMSDKHDRIRARLERNKPIMYWLLYISLALIVLFVILIIL